MAGEICCKTYVHSVTKSFPSPGISFLQPPPHSDFSSSSNEQDTSKHLKDIHMLGCLMEDFLNAASDNTNKNLETCGVLGAFLKDETFYVTTLIIPKQEATSNSAVNEEDIFAIQNEESSFPVGWIHTHPSQSCFMSSTDLHTQYTYQPTFVCFGFKVMVPEAVGIVMAPTDNSRKCGIFRLTADGMSILRECQEKGFHTHTEPDNGSPVYELLFSSIVLYVLSISNFHKKQKLGEKIEETYGLE